jgi:DnaJ-domain-containing protein 1
MSWAGKFFSGMLGGPAGASPGHRSDDDDVSEDEALAELEQPEFTPVVVSAGPAIRFDFTFSAGSSVPDGTVVFVQLLDAGGALVGGLGEWADEDGDFCAVAELRASDDDLASAEVAVPLLAPEEPERVHTVRALAMRGETLVAGPTEWSCDRFRRRTRWEESRLGAATAVAVALCRADGGPSAAERAAIVEALVEGFELDEDGEAAARATLAALMGRPSNYEAWFRRDAEFAAAIAELLTTVALVDGELEPYEAAFIARFRKQFGVPDEAPEAEEDGDAEEEAATQPPAPDSLGAHYAALDLQPGASFPEIKAAYRRLAAEYHPDRSSKLAVRFQDFATREMQRLNAAYEALSRALKH